VGQMLFSSFGLASSHSSGDLWNAIKRNAANKKFTCLLHKCLIYLIS
jgi:hypothetical protein